MSYLTQQQLDASTDLPVSLPITDIYPDEWLVVSTARISASQTLTLRWLQAFVVTSEDPSVASASDGSVVTQPNSSGQCVFPAQDPQLVTAGLGLAFVGVYRDFNPLIQPAFQAPQESPLVIGNATSGAPVYAVRQLTPTVFSSAGAYSFVICNNTLNRLLRVVVNGSIRASLGLNP